jgi:hypothetical protein
MTFEAYLQERWGWSRQRGYQLIQAADVVTDLAADGMTTRVDTPTEAHARALVSLPPSERRAPSSRSATSASTACVSCYQAARLMKASIRARPAAPGLTQPASGPDRVVDLIVDDRIEQGLAEQLPPPTKGSA